MGPLWFPTTCCGRARTPTQALTPDGRSYRGLARGVLRGRCGGAEGHAGRARDGDQVKITAAAREMFGAWRDRTHADLVLACWWAEWQQPWHPGAFGGGGDSLPAAPPFLT